MEDDIKIIEKQIGITDPFPFLFREIDQIHSNIKELKRNQKNHVQQDNGMYQNQLDRIEYKIEETYKRMDWLFLLGLINFLAVILLIIKLVFF